MLKKNRLTAVVACVLGLAISCAAEDPNAIHSELAQFFGQLQNEQMVTVRISDMDIKNADPNSLLSFLTKYQTSNNAGVRSFVYKFEAKAARFHRARAVRCEVVERLVNALVSKEEIDRELQGTYADLLYGFEDEDFNPKAKAAILSALGGDNPRKELIRVSGVAQLREALPRLAGLLLDEAEFETKWQRIGRKWYYTAGWNARLARARMGIEGDINKCIQLVDRVQDTHLKIYHLLPAVAYIRQPQAIQYLRGYLNSDIVLKTDCVEEPVAAFVLDLLAESVRDFPIEKKPGRGYGQDEIKQARKWMREQSQWNIIR
jgi:hypothetical protein